MRTTAEGLADVTGTASLENAQTESTSAPATAGDQTATHDAAPREQEPASGTITKPAVRAEEVAAEPASQPEPSLDVPVSAGPSSPDPSSTQPSIIALSITAPSTTARPAPRPSVRPPAIPKAAKRTPLPPPLPRTPDFELGAPLLPEHAHDPKYYPGVNDESPVLVLESLSEPPYLAFLRTRLGRGVAAGAGALLLIIVLRSLLSGSHDAALVVDVTPKDARVTLDGELLAETAGTRKRAGLMNGEHVLAAERSGFVSERRVFTYDERHGDRRMVLALNPEPPPPTAAAAPETPPPPAAAPEAAASEPSAALTQETSPEPERPVSARELARERRLERIRARKAAREARLAAGEPAPAASQPGKSGPPGTLKLNSVPWAEVYIDRKHVGHTPLIGFSLSPGRHVIKLTNPTLRANKTVRVKVAPGETVTQVVKL